MDGLSSAQRLAAAVQRDRERISAGMRPCYHATWSISPEGAFDVRVAELPIAHLFLPDRARLRDGVRLMIAKTLGVDPETFDIEIADQAGAGVADDAGAAGAGPAVAETDTDATPR